MADLNNLAPYAEGAFLTGLLADWAQTRQTARDPQNKTEMNPILGPHPSQGKVNLYMPLAGLAQYAGYKYLPDDYKFPYALGSALIEGNVVNNNRKLGQAINPGAIGLGGLLTYLLARNHTKGEEQRIEPYVDRSNPNTPVTGITWKW